MGSYRHDSDSGSERLLEAEELLELLIGACELGELVLSDDASRPCVERSGSWARNSGRRSRRGFS